MQFLEDPFLIAFMVAGIALLLAGRKLVWLLAGAVGFFVAFPLIQTWLPDVGVEVRLALGVAAGLIAMGLALFVQKVGVGVVGLGAGALAVYWLISNAGYAVEGWLWALVIVGAVSGWWLARGVFELGLTILSAVAGSTLIFEATGSGASYQPLPLLILAAVGVLAQMFLFRKRD